MSTPEGVVKDYLKDELHSMGVMPTLEVVKAIKNKEEETDIVGWYFMPAANGMGEAGIADFVLCVMGLYLEIEVKAEGKNPTGIQKLHGDVIGYSMGEWFCVSGTKGVDELTPYLKHKVAMEIVKLQMEKDMSEKISNPNNEAVH